MIKRAVGSEKIKPRGLKFTHPLMFGEWPPVEVQKALIKIHCAYDLTGWELSNVSRGGYKKCKGYGEHEACPELVETYGEIVFIRKSLDAD